VPPSPALAEELLAEERVLPNSSAFLPSRLVLAAEPPVLHFLLPRPAVAMAEHCYPAQRLSPFWQPAGQGFDAKHPVSHHPWSALEIALLPC
jgi:hypothetical protein